MKHPVVHFEIGCRNTQKTQSFYQELFAWDMQAMGPAVMIAGESGGIGGHINSLGHEPHNYTLFYVQVDDIAASLAKAEKLGGKVIVPEVEIPTGFFAWFADPEGNTVGVWKPKSA